MTLRLIMGVALAVFFLSVDAAAQCPGGKPPNPDGTCGGSGGGGGGGRSNPRRGAPAEPTNCTISVLIYQQGSTRPLPRVSLSLNSGNGNNVITDSAGGYTFKGLACNRDYVVTPMPRTDFTFEPASTTVKVTKKNNPINFMAVPRGQPAPAVSTAAPPTCKPSSAPPPEVKIGASLSGKLNPETALCETGRKGFFNPYLIKGALGGDVVQFDFQSLQTTDLFLELYDQSGTLLKFEAPASASDVPIQQLVLPKPGDYTLCVVSSANRSSNYRVNVVRKGLTEEGYREQLGRAYEAIREPGNLDFYDSFNNNIERLRSFDNIQATDQRIRAAAQLLEQLREVQPDRPQALSMLAVINLYYRKDSESAIDLAIKSLKLGGEARFRGIFGQKLDRKERRVTSNARTGWLIVKNGQLSFEAAGQSDEEIFKTERQVLGKRSLDIPEFALGLSLYGKGAKEDKKDKEKKEFKLDSYEFIPASAADPNYNFPVTEVALIKTLIKRFVQME
ncbi:MAG TPA: hypothetical protein VJ302_15550 [Blastocatellia bacterium]|nr:hypothetical protein [Blastocatellia bacterium]